MYQLQITETGSNCPKGHLENASIFNDILENFNTVDEAKEYLIDRYGKMPNGKKKIYIDTDNGVEAVGFLHSFWNKDWSHNTKNWFQTDWISLHSVTKQPILLI